MPVTWQDLDHELERIFGLWPLRKHLWSDKETLSSFPKVDIKEEKNQYVVIADVPGMEAQDLKIEIDKELLTISGSRKEEHKTKEDKGFIRVERSSGTFSRQIYLPGTTDAEEAHADYENGTLTVIIPKQKACMGKKISIKKSSKKRS